MRKQNMSPSRATESAVLALSPTRGFLYVLAPETRGLRALAIVLSPLRGYKVSYRAYPGMKKVGTVWPPESCLASRKGVAERF